MQNILVSRTKNQAKEVVKIIENKGFKAFVEPLFLIKNFVIKKQISPDLVSNFNFIKLNEHEYLNFSDEVKKLYPNKLIVTLGSKGAKYMDIIYPSPDPRETIDVSGAGDTFTASFTVKYLETKNIEESIIFANKMASIVVQKRGVSVPITRQKK